MKFIFDLDGTITAEETLPVISEHFGIGQEIAKLTKETVRGNIPFIESFIKRIHILKEYPVSEINRLLSKVALNTKIVQFITENRDDCIIATGNYHGWIESLANEVGCKYFASEGLEQNDSIVKLTNILKKENVVKEYKAKGETVIFIGDGNNDVEAMREADISIACGIIHAPAKSVLSVADYAIFDELSLYRLMYQIYKKQSGKSIILSCAGIGSRLGLGLTKALIEIENKPLIHYQLESFGDFEDIRVVVGYQADDVITKVLEKRKDVIFVYNHDYFYTKTGTSFYLGARHGNEYAIAWDGDLLVHPNDIEKCLNYTGEYIGCSKVVTDDAVFANVNEQGCVLSFSTENGDYEWSGPACIKKDKIKYTSGHVFTQIEEHLPIKALIVEAQDIDTYEDYIKAKNFIKEWNMGNGKIINYYQKMAENISSPLETRNKAKDFSKYDIALLKQYADKNKTLLDLGSGTGLTINHLIDSFSYIEAVEKFKKFSDFITKSDKIKIINSDLKDYTPDRLFDIISIFGVMNFFNENEAISIYRKAYNALYQNGIMIVKHQMGVKEDVLINGFSEELQEHYYSEYRYLEKEKSILKKVGFKNIEVIDIYPDEYNRWDNTHFYALICHK